MTGVREFLVQDPDGCLLRFSKFLEGVWSFISPLNKGGLRGDLLLLPCRKTGQREIQYHSHFVRIPTPLFNGGFYEELGIVQAPSRRKASQDLTTPPCTTEQGAYWSSRVRRQTRRDPTLGHFFSLANAIMCSMEVVSGEFDASFGYFCLEADSVGSWSASREGVEMKFGEQNRVMVSIVFLARARMYFLDKGFVEAFIAKVLTAAHTPKEPGTFHHRSRVRTRLRWSGLTITGFSASGRVDEADLRSQEEALAEMIHDFAVDCERKQSHVEVA